MRPIQETQMENLSLQLDGIYYQISALLDVARRIECVLRNQPIPDEIKDFIFDDLCPNGRVVE